MATGWSDLVQYWTDFKNYVDPKTWKNKAQVKKSLNYPLIHHKDNLSPNFSPRATPNPTTTIKIMTFTFFISSAQTNHSVLSTVNMENMRQAWFLLALETWKRKDFEADLDSLHFSSFSSCVLLRLYLITQTQKLQLNSSQENSTLTSFNDCQEHLALM